MLRTRARVFTIVLAMLPLGVSAQQSIDGGWNAQFDGDRVHINFQTGLDRGRNRPGWSNYGRTLDVRDLGRIDRSGGRMQFTLRRAAGTFSFEGRGDSEQAAGSFEFVPNAGFRGEMARLGFGDLTDSNLFVFALEDLTISGVRQLRAQLSDEIDARDLVNMINHGAGPRHVQQLTDLGLRDLRSSDYVRARDHGVTARFIEEMHDAGFRLGLDQLIRSKDHGVTPEFAAAMRELGHELSHEELIRSRDHGVTTQFIRDLRELGYDRLPISDYIRLRDHGVTASYVRRVKQLYSETPSVERLIRLRSQGDIR